MIRRHLRASVLAMGLASGLAAGLLGGGALAQSADVQALMGRAQDGDIAAQVALAELYHTGTEVVQNYGTAAHWAAQAAMAGNADAQNLLGRYFHAGIGVTVSRAEALKWLAASAAQGAPAHIFDYARVVEENKEDPAALALAAELYARAADADHQEAQVNLGVMYQDGLGVAQDYDRAHALYSGPAEAGHARAQNNLGLLYVRGSGVAQDYARAADLFAAAAEQGLKAAIGNLGVMYENGFGVPQDDAEAARLYRLSGAGAAPAQPSYPYDARLLPPPTDPAAQAALHSAAKAGDPVAAFQLGWMLVNTEAPTFNTWREAADLFAYAAHRGYPAAMLNLGILYMQGRGRPQDFAVGLHWMVLAHAGGHPDAAAAAKALEHRMTPSQINEAHAMADKDISAAR